MGPVPNFGFVFAVFVVSALVGLAGRTSPVLVRRYCETYQQGLGLLRAILAGLYFLVPGFSSVRSLSPKPRFAGLSRLFLP